ncbi:hypothetical protein SJ05684_c11010 [Sinorhizobium sojae CCBAU 05684]|uniref:Uncharacterized protein n=1 Tax=Sinorhizobium sojae CCBAU 05684 TaxID=716928 RepID=A0A249PA33_9HYPH|nr:hypothetical protein SJ05684_c11010 [Sinorhizobium sojae CCBAU 05684]
MSHGGKDDAGKAGDAGRIGEEADHDETLGEALSREGFEPAKVGRKVMSQGRRREPLKKGPPKGSSR